MFRSLILFSVSALVYIVQGEQWCTGPHEYYSCGNECDNVCATLDKQNQTHCPIVSIRCNDMCYCEEGYARDARRECAPIDQCGRGAQP